MDGENHGKPLLNMGWFGGMITPIFWKHPYLGSCPLAGGCRKSPDPWMPLFWHVVPRRPKRIPFFEMGIPHFSKLVGLRSVSWPWNAGLVQCCTWFFFGCWKSCHSKKLAVSRGVVVKHRMRHPIKLAFTTVRGTTFLGGWGVILDAAIKVFPKIMLTPKSSHV